MINLEMRRKVGHYFDLWKEISPTNVAPTRHLSSDPNGPPPHSRRFLHRVTSGLLLFLPRIQFNCAPKRTARDQATYLAAARTATTRLATLAAMRVKSLSDKLNATVKRTHSRPTAPQAMALRLHSSVAHFSNARQLARRKARAAHG